MAEKRTVAAEPSAASLAGYTEVSSPAVYATYGGHEHVREAEEGRGSGRRSGSESAAKSGLSAAVSRSNYGTNGSYTSGSMSRGGGGGGGKQGSPRGRGYGSTSKGTESPGYSMTPIGESSPSLSTKLYAWDVSTSPEAVAGMKSKTVPGKYATSVNPVSVSPESKSAPSLFQHNTIAGTTADSAERRHSYGGTSVTAGDFTYTPGQCMVNSLKAKVRGESTPLVSKGDMEDDRKSFSMMKVFMALAITMCVIMFITGVIFAVAYAVCSTAVKHKTKTAEWGDVDSISQLTIHHTSYSGKVVIKSDVGAKNITCSVTTQAVSDKALSSVKLDYKNTHNSLTATVSGLETWNMYSCEAVSEEWVLPATMVGLSLTIVTEHSDVTVDAGEITFDKITLQSSTGNIAVKGVDVTGSMSVKSESGDITITHTTAPDVTLYSVGGDVKVNREHNGGSGLRLSDDYNNPLTNCRLSARTEHGHIDLNSVSVCNVFRDVCSISASSETGDVSLDLYEGDAGLDCYYIGKYDVLAPGGVATAKCKKGTECSLQKQTGSDSEGYVYQDYGSHTMVNTTTGDASLTFWPGCPRMTSELSGPSSE